MTKREAKIEALRIATAILSNGIDSGGWDNPEMEDKDNQKVLEALKDFRLKTYINATKMGGEFNAYTGY